ncbi:flagellar motor protein [Paenibacillaceae bacterium]|nr:flagellar motor protein [Paenibacillaceae bacterium]
MRRRRRRESVPPNHERWLITYADLITLLMIFFVILYAMSQLDIKKYEAFAQSMQFEYRKSDSMIEQGSGMLGALDRSKFPEQGELGADTSVPVLDSESNKQTLEEALQRAREKELQDLLSIIQAYVVENHLEDQIFVSDTPKGIAIRLSDIFLFDLGKADLKPESRPVLDKLASLFTQLDTLISIEGHTDNLPIQAGGAFQDNWGLSAARSLSVLRYFIDTAELPPDIFEIAGYGDTRPVADNDSNANRQKNRRVEITVLRSEK